MIDVFTTLPESAEKGESLAPKYSNFATNAHSDKNPAPQIAHAYDKATHNEVTESPKRKVIKKSKASGALVSTLSRDTSRWKAVKDAIG